jgi:glutamate synthase domain-containing protein 3
MVRLERISDPADAEDVAALVWYHAQATRSARAAALLDNWRTALDRFWRVVPRAGEGTARPLESVVANLRLAPRPVA